MEITREQRERNIDRVPTARQALAKSVTRVINACSSKAHPRAPRSWLAMQKFQAPDLLNQNLHFNKSHGESCAHPPC